MASERKYNEMIIIDDCKPTYAILLEDRRENKSSRTSYIKIYNGNVVFREGYKSDFTAYNIGDETHRLAKETFTLQLQACIKEKINDLKILEEVFKEIGQEEHITSFITAEFVEEIKMLDYKHC